MSKERTRNVLSKLQAQHGYVDYNSTQRPKSVKRVQTLSEAEQWRKQVLQEISQKLLKIGDEKLSDYQIRDLNDELNKLMREKLAWEYHIKSLGGPDYVKSDLGKVSGGVVIRGYRYFGRAKELAGVKEILNRQESDKNENKKKREEKKSQLQRWKELESRVGMDYFGYRDEISMVNDGDVQFRVEDQVRDILGDLVGDDLHDVDQSKDLQPRKLQDELLRFERSATKKRTKKIISQRAPSDDNVELFLIDDNAPPCLQEIEGFLVERRKRQLEERLNI